MKLSKKAQLLIHGLVVFLILFVAGLPVLSVAIAGEIATANGCELNEGSVNPCIVNGEDIGETLYSMGMMGWFMLVTIPVGLGLVAFYLIVVAVFYITRAILRSRRAASAVN